MKQEQMTNQVRAYLFGASVRHLVMGVAIMAIPSTFNTDAYQHLFDIFPRPIWLLAIFLEGLYLGFAALTGKEKHARASLIAASTLCLMFAVGFALVVAAGVASATAAILFLDLCYKDLVICTGPLRSPLAPLMRTFSAEATQ